MLSCSQCQRFLREDALSCPFCGSARATAFAPVGAAIALGVMLVGCGPTVAGGEGETARDDDDDDVTSVSLTNSGDDDDDGPVTAPGTNNTTMPDTTDPTVGTSITTAESTSTTAGDDDPIDDNGCAFYGGCPDLGPSPYECDVWAQDCPEGEKCMPWANDGNPSWNATKCSPLDPTPAQPGEPCTVEGSAYSGIDDCDIAAMCWNVDAENEGTCVAMCGGSEASPVCPDTMVCLMRYVGAVNVCVEHCDPLMQDCVEGAACVALDDGFFCVPDNSGDLGALGDDCLQFDECDPGLYCMPGGSVPDCAGLSCCAPYCDLAGPDPNGECSIAVAEGTACIPLYEDGPGSTVGVCAIPE